MRLDPTPARAHNPAGRTFDTGVGIPWRHLGALLVANAMLTPAQLEEAFAEQKETHARLGEVLVGRGWLTTADLAVALAQQYALEFVDLESTEIDPDAAALMSEATARRLNALPIRRLDARTVLVAVGDPASVVGTDELLLALDTDAVLVVADSRDLELAIGRVYRPDLQIDDADETPTPDQTYREREEIWQAATGAPAVKIVNAALAQAIEEGASDVHFEPEEDLLRVRARVDGVLREIATIPKHHQAGVTSRLKIMGSLDIAERRAPQDGRVFVRCAGNPVDLRIAVLPTTHGEQVVLRVLHRAASRLTLKELGMSADAEAVFTRAVRQPYGAIIVCGPTGSGKTTTLYSALQLLNEPGRSLMTIEDPVEYQVPGVAQIEVRPKSGLTFARGLRTILRSDPDALLVGEIRDSETARIAIQAAMTGHLVLTSLHTHNAASSIERLKDMGVEASLLASAINCIVAQRLARKLCVECREPVAATAEELDALGLPATREPLMLYRPVGCMHCRSTGFRGRVALYEVLPVQGLIRHLVHSSTEEIFKAAIGAGMKTMRQDGIRHCLDGVTTLDEIARVTGDRLA